MRYYIADLHLYHENLNEKMDCRGFSSAEDMNDYIIQKWNAKVKPVDEVIILGDVSMGTAEKTTQVLQKLSGRLFLIKGNHDHFLKHRKFDSSIFGWIESYKEMRDNKRKVVLCHYPMFCYNGQYRKGEDGNPLTYMLYGHVHNTRDEQLVNDFINRSRQTVYKSVYTGQEETLPCQMINCFCMFSDYTPLTLDEWIVVDERRRSMLNGKP